ncbi:hypothetical protein LFL96_13215 [Paraburkholderia sp. D15]|uniref:hypothetical protein n=1 Tax=Paraburkholderia sp. D15 TaxID=2880218 RepID=UPI0024794E2F|nr:hypothetical protein [Paraburkholderia sp. D15]WGS48740.1 hypothetical protein LFL96_13215 [Paraburkholderia sp. D15]WKF56623.1 hypothetical protein HUO10_001082 [Paraburkholderia busanensis]
MKWLIRFLAVLATLAAITLLMWRLPGEDAIRVAGYAGTAAFAVLVNGVLRWRASRAHQRNR